MLDDDYITELLNSSITALVDVQLNSGEDYSYSKTSRNRREYTFVSDILDITPTDVILTSSEVLVLRYFASQLVTMATFKCKGSLQVVRGHK